MIWKRLYVKYFVKEIKYLADKKKLVLDKEKLSLKNGELYLDNDRGEIVFAESKEAIKADGFLERLIDDLITIYSCLDKTYVKTRSIELKNIVARKYGVDITSNIAMIASLLMAIILWGYNLINSAKTPIVQIDAIKKIDQFKLINKLNEIQQSEMINQIERIKAETIDKIDGLSMKYFILSITVLAVYIFGVAISKIYSGNKKSYYELCLGVVDEVSKLEPLINESTIESGKIESTAEVIEEKYVCRKCKAKTAIYNGKPGNNYHSKCPKAGSKGQHNWVKENQA